MSRRIALLGLSGVGKSTLVARLGESIPVRHLQASALIKAEHALRTVKQVSSEDLRLGSVLDNQALLIAAFQREAASTQLPVVFDGHSIIDGRDGIIQIPSEVFAAFDLTAVCFLSADPHEIARRRLLDTTRERPRRDAATLAMHQEIAKDAAIRIACAIQRPFFPVDADDVVRLLEMLTWQHGFQTTMLRAVAEFERAARAALAIGVPPGHQLPRRDPNFPDGPIVRQTVASGFRAAFSAGRLFRIREF